MSIYATNFIIDEETGEAKLVKHLNQRRIDRCYAGTPPGKWNKTGRKKRNRYLSKNAENNRTIDYFLKFKGIDLTIPK